MIKKFLNSLVQWETFALLGILMLFVVGGWYAKYYEGSDESMVFVMWFVSFMGTVFLVASFFSWRKKQRIAKQQNEELEKRKLNNS